MANIDKERNIRLAEAVSRQARQARADQRKARVQLKQSGLEAQLDKLFEASGASRFAFNQMLEQYLEKER
jgi:hypothetical protein